MAVIRCQKFFQGMIDLARFALVFRTSGQTADQSVAAVRGLQQQGSASGTAPPLIELQRARLGQIWGTTNTVLCYGQTPKGLSYYCKLCLNNMFVAEEAIRVFQIMNKAGQNGPRD